MTCQQQCLGAQNSIMAHQAGLLVQLFLQIWTHCSCHFW
jgi:hypothetical protein